MVSDGKERRVGTTVKENKKKCDEETTKIWQRTQREAIVKQTKKENRLR